MRYLSHIDPGNSGGSVPAPESPFGVYQPKPVTFECPICHASFLSKEEMRSHRIAEHPVKRPYLLFNGRAYLKPELVIHETLTPDSIDFLDTLSAVIDGQPIDSADELKDVLLSKQTGRHTIKLCHRNYSVEHEVLFDIIPESTLKKVEECFYSAFANEVLSVSSYKRFCKELRDSALDNNTYAGGLSCYITGVLTKDRSQDIGLDFEKYIDKFGEAEDKLTAMNRPLAQTIVFSLRFNRNHFGSPGRYTDAPALESAVQLMKSGRFADVLTTHDEHFSRFPTDFFTELLVKFCSLGDKYRNESADDLESTLKQNRMASDDMIKLTYILMAHYLTIGNISRARQLFRKVKFDDVLGKQAIELMEQYTDE